MDVKPSLCLYHYNSFPATLHSSYLPATASCQKALLSTSFYSVTFLWESLSQLTLLQLNFRSNSLSLITIPSTLLSHPISPVLLLPIVQHVFSMGDKLFLLLSKLGSSTPASGRLFVLFPSSGMFSDFFIVQEFPLRISLTALTLDFSLVYIFS